MTWPMAVVLTMTIVGMLGVMGGILWIFHKFLLCYASLKLEMTRLVGLNAEANSHETVLKMNTTDAETKELSEDEILDEDRERQNIWDDVVANGMMTENQEKILSRG